MDENVSAEKFLNIFQGRQDAYGKDVVINGEATVRAIYKPVNEDVVARHLYGEHTIGIYPIRFILDETTEETLPQDLRVRWGCCDIDTGEWNEAYRLAKALKAMGLNPWVERSRSKGWHIWVFVPRSVAAYEMRRCLKIAYAAIGLPAKEANPKSELLQPSQLGNYVRLPYPGAMTWTEHEWYHGPPKRQVMLSSWTADHTGTPISLQTWLNSTDIYSNPEVVQMWASRWREPERQAIVVDHDDKDIAPLVEKLPRPLRSLYEKGPKAREGRLDTSQGLVALAHNLAQSGEWTPSDVYVVVASADRRWGKFHARNNPETYYTDIVERAFR